MKSFNFISTSVSRCFIFILVILLFSGCKKSSLKEETPIAKQTKSSASDSSDMIVYKQNGITIEYCMLNEKGLPATIFREGENFKFHLGIVNNIEPDSVMWVVSNFLRNPKLFMVYDNVNDSIGAPIKLFFIYKRGDPLNMLELGGKWSFDVFWEEKRGTEIPSLSVDNMIIAFQHRFIGLNQKPLPKGKYYSEFRQNFCLGRFGTDNPFNLICTDTLKLHIDFEIQ